MSERELRLRTIEGIFELLDSSGRYEGPAHDALTTYSNGYGCWLIDANNPTTTRPLTAEEILSRIEAREALSAPKQEAG